MNEHCIFHNKLHILFTLRYAQLTADGTVIIYCRITLNKVRATINGFSTGIKIYPEQWCQKEQKVLGDSELATLANEKLQRMKVDIMAILANYELLRKPINAKILYQTYTLGGTNTMEVNKNPTLVSLFVDYRDFLEDTEDISEEYSTRLNCEINHMKAFALHFFKNENIRVQELISDDFQRDIVFYFTKICKFSTNYCIKRYEAILRVFDWARRKKKIDHDPMEGFKKPKKEKPKPIIYLTQAELDKLYYFKFFSENLEKVADCFLFGCYTGLANVDLLNLKNDQLQIDEDGSTWLKGARTKTRNGYIVPLLPRAKEILQKYGGKLENLPIPCNTIYNKLLKQVGAMLSFKIKLTTHVARKTFAMQALNTWQLPMETVSKMLGHESIVVTQSTYAQINETRIKKDTAKLLQPQGNVIQPTQNEILKFSTI